MVVKHKILKVFGCFLLMIAVMLTNLPVSMASETNGECGNNLEWFYNPGIGKLIITGKGEMWPYYGSVELPWFPYLEDIKTVEIEKNVTKIGQSAFEDCINLETVIIPSTVKEIESFAFASCENLSNITIPGSVTEMGTNVFDCCYSLPEIKLPEGIAAIPDGTFSNCINLETVELPGSLFVISFNAFENCTSLENVYYNGTETEWSEVSVWDGNGDLLNASFTFMKVEPPAQVPEDEGNISVPPVHNENEDNTTPAETPTEEPTEPSTEKSTENEQTFEGICGDNAEWVFEPSNGKLTITGTGDIYPKEQLPDFWFSTLKDATVTVEIGEGITGIGNYAFENFSKLSKIDLPESIQRIGQGAFKGCNAISDIVYDGNEKDLLSFIEAGNESVKNYFSEKSAYTETATQSANEPTDGKDEHEDDKQKDGKDSSSKKKTVIMIAVIVLLVEILIVAVVLLVRKNKKKNRPIEY